MEVQQGLGVLKQVVDLSVSKGGIFDNSEQVSVVNTALKVVAEFVDRHTEGPGVVPEAKQPKKGKVEKV